MLKTVVFIFVVICESVLVNSQSCTTPNKTPGQCVLISRCEPIYKVFLAPPIPDDVILFLRSSACGFENNQPKVCCGSESSFIKKQEETEVVEPVTEEPSTYERNPNWTPSKLLPKAPYCGISGLSDRILGGNETDIDEFPWLALLRYRTSKNTLTFSCGGALINNRYILTAAHCVTGQILRVVGELVSVRLGEYDTSSDEDCVISRNKKKDCADPVQDIPVERSIPHPEYIYGRSQSVNDIALIRLSSPAVEGDFVKFLCLPAPETASARTADRLIVAGWGKTLTALASNIKLKVDVPVVDLEACIAMFRKNYKIELGEGHLCAGGEFSKDSCTGDSGGPLMKSIGTTWYCEAVVSFGLSCGVDGRPGVYTKTSYYMDWINASLQP